jgi:hypothetical protein
MPDVPWYCVLAHKLGVCPVLTLQVVNFVTCNGYAGKHKPPCDAIIHKRNNLNPPRSHSPRGAGRNRTDE